MEKIQILKLAEEKGAQRIRHCGRANCDLHRTIFSDSDLTEFVKEIIARERENLSEFFLTHNPEATYSAKQISRMLEGMAVDYRTYG